MWRNSVVEERARASRLSRPRASVGSEDLKSLVSQEKTSKEELLENTSGGAQSNPDELATKLRRFLENPWTDTAMGIIIILNVVLMVSETNTKAACAKDQICTETWQDVCNYTFQGIYTLELGCRVYAYKRAFIKSNWNILDAVIVFVGFLDIIVSLALSGGSLPGPGVSILRIFRMTRLLRSVRILSFFPELYAMIRGFVGAMMAMFWGMFMIIVLLLVWSILAVEVINSIVGRMNMDNDWCLDGFSSVQKCMLLFFQTVFAGDSWGACAVPIIQEEWYTVVIFAGALITIQLGFTNLVLAVIVERAAKAQENDITQRMREQQKRHQKATEELVNVMTVIDEDGSGQLSMDEVMKGYDTNQELPRILSLMDIGKDDLKTMFRLLEDENGLAEIQDFVENLERCESQDTRRQMLLMGLQITSIQRTLEDTWKTISGGAPADRQKTRAFAEAERTDDTDSFAQVDQQLRRSLEELQAGLRSTIDDRLSELARHLDDFREGQDRILSSIDGGAEVGRRGTVAKGGRNRRPSEPGGGLEEDGAAAGAPEQKRPPKKPKNKLPSSRTLSSASKEEAQDLPGPPPEAPESPESPESPELP